MAIGCHNFDNTCFIILDGPGFGVNQGCVNSGTGVRWDNGDTSEGKRTYATFLADYLAGKKVDITLYGCSRQSFPTLIWYVVVN